MVIHYFGDGCFRLQSGDVSCLIDPNNNRLKADVVLKTTAPTNAESIDSHEISFPGEYEVKGLEIQGVPVEAESSAKILKTMYVVRWDDISFVFLGHISAALQPDQLEKLGEPDVLFLPIDGEKFLSPDQASKLVKQLSPHFVIPSFTKNPSVLYKALGQNPKPQEKLIFKKKDLTHAQPQVVLLERKE